MDGVDVSPGVDWHRPRAGDAGEALHGNGPERPEMAVENPFVRAWRTSIGAGNRLGMLAKTKPHLALGIAAGAGVVAGVLVGTRFARFVALLAAGYAMRGVRVNFDPLLQAGVDRLAKALAG
jgi:hypothetical protein